MNVKNTTKHHVRKPAPLIYCLRNLWYPIYDFFFETVKRIEFIYFYWNEFPNIWELNKRWVQNHDILCSQLSSFTWLLTFLVILKSAKHPCQWALIKLRFKKELIKRLLELLLAIFGQLFFTWFLNMIIKNEVLSLVIISDIYRCLLSSDFQKTNRKTLQLLVNCFIC